MNKKILSKFLVASIIPFALVCVTHVSAAVVAGVALPTTPSGLLSSAAVASTAALDSYTAAALASDATATASASTTDDAKIGAVSYQDNGVTATFTQPAKFLGLFPTSIETRAVVQADGNVTLSYPWYSFLLRKHAAAISNIFQTQITEATVGKPGIGTDASATLPPQTKAAILDAIRHAVHGLRSRAAISAAATAAVTAGQ